MSTFLLRRALFYGAIFAMVLGAAKLSEGSLDPKILAYLPQATLLCFTWIMAILWCAVVVKTYQGHGPRRVAALDRMWDDSGRVVPSGTLGMLLSDPERCLLVFVADNTQRVSGVREDNFVRL